MLSFRYKLSIIISAVALLVLGLFFIAVEHEIEQEFRVVIEQRLQQAQDVVNQRMKDRFDRLRIQAVAVSENKLTQDIVTDKGLSRLTSDDIARSEILPSLDMAEYLLVTDGDGDLLADSSLDDAFWLKIQQQFDFKNSIDGSLKAGLVVHDHRWLQWLLVPVFIGDQLFGTVTMVSALDESKLEEISQLAGTELLAITGGMHLATEWQSESAMPLAQSTLNTVANQARQGQYSDAATTEVSLQGERFLLRYQVPDVPFTPPFIVAQSLDQALSFVQVIKQAMLTISLVALVVAIVLGFVFASRLSRPVYKLRQATRAIANEDFEQRVDINTRDEFRELGESFNRMSESLAEKAKIRTALDKSVSREVAEHLLQQGVELGGETREASILFADIRDFTRISEQLPEQQLLDMLNRYFTRINTCIQLHHGTIDKFIGDAVMAIFGAPADDEHHAWHAVQSALAMVEAIDGFNAELQQQVFKVGIGINSGQVVSGLMGSVDRLNYTVLGDQVNIASRVESLSKFYGASILLTEETRGMAQASDASSIQYRRLDTVQLKGKSVGINLFEPIPACPGLEEQLAKYNQALEKIFACEFESAVRDFETYVEAYPEDEVARKWLQRCQSYAGSPDLFDRDYEDGVRIMETK